MDVPEAEYVRRSAVRASWLASFFLMLLIVVVLHFAFIDEAFKLVLEMGRGEGARDAEPKPGSCEDKEKKEQSRPGPRCYCTPVSLTGWPTSAAPSLASRAAASLLTQLVNSLAGLNAARTVWWLLLSGTSGTLEKFALQKSGAPGQEFRGTFKDTGFCLLGSLARDFIVPCT